MRRRRVAHISLSAADLALRSSDRCSAQGPPHPLHTSFVRHKARRANKLLRTDDYPSLIIVDRDLEATKDVESDQYRNTCGWRKLVRVELTGVCLGLLSPLSMWEFVKTVLRSAVSAAKGRRALALENLALRQQLAVLK